MNSPIPSATPASSNSQAMPVSSIPSSVPQVGRPVRLQPVQPFAGVRLVATVFLALALGACARLGPPRPPAVPAVVPPAVAQPPAPARARLDPVDYGALPGWPEDNLSEAWEALRRTCSALSGQPSWATACQGAQGIEPGDGPAMRRFFESRFVPHRVSAADGKQEGMLTGYYEPLLKGSRTKDERFPVPVYGVPDDLITVDLASVVPDSRNLRLKGRLAGKRLVPYWSRADIDAGRAPLGGRELLWVDDPVELFFLQVQGSGRVQLPTGEVVRVGYADQNGHPYRSIGRVLVERGQLPVERASMQGIKAWARDNPDRLPALLNENPSYVFFRELPAGSGGPLGSLGVPLTPGRSIAIDPSVIPLGAPVFISSVWPGSGQPLRRLVLAQDTGGAIKGAVRADFFWGFGPEAGEGAGRMRQPLQMWVLLPATTATP